MGAHDDREMLEVAIEECGRLEREVAFAKARIRGAVKDFDAAYRRADNAEDAVDVLKAERDALAAVIEQVRRWDDGYTDVPDLETILATSPAQSLANLQAALVLEYIDGPEHAESLREAAYEAWDRGKRTGSSRAMRMMSDEPGLFLEVANPYRKTTGSDQS